MILPTKHLSLDSSLLGIGAKALRVLEVPATVPELWRTVRHEPGVNNFNRFCDALVFLYLIGMVDLDPAGALLRLPR